MQVFSIKYIPHLGGIFIFVFVFVFVYVHLMPVLRRGCVARSIFPNGVILELVFRCMLPYDEVAVSRILLKTFLQVSNPEL